MKKYMHLIIGIIIGIVTTTSLSVFATVSKKSVEIDYTDIKITIDGREIIPRNAGGIYQEPFALEGTTYLPIRGLAFWMGYDVEWDSKTKTVKLTDNNGKYAIPEYVEGERYYTVDGIWCAEYDEQYYVVKSEIEKLYKDKGVGPLGRYRFFVTELYDSETKSFVFTDLPVSDVFNYQGIPLEYYYSTLLPWLSSL